MENQTAAAQKIFFSYSRADGQEHALKLANDLRSAGANVWIDQQNIELGKLWDLEVEKALNTADCVLFIATKKSTASNNVLNEVYYALDENKKVIPAVFHDCRIPFQLRRLQRIDFTTDYNAAFERLLKALGLKNEIGSQTENVQKPVAISLPKLETPIKQESTIENPKKPVEPNLHNLDIETSRVTSNKAETIPAEQAHNFHEYKKGKSWKPVFLGIGVVALAALVFVLFKIFGSSNSNKPTVLSEQYPIEGATDTSASNSPSNNKSGTTPNTTEATDREKNPVPKGENNALSDDEKYQRYFAAGLNHLEQKRYKEAIDDFTNAIKIKDEAPVFFQLGACYAGLNDYANAINYYGKAIERNPKNWKSFAARAVANHNNKDYKASVEDWSEVINLTTGDEQANAYYRRGVNKNGLKDAAGACSDFAVAGKLGNTAGQKAYDKNCGTSHGSKIPVKSTLENLKTKRAASSEARY